MGRHGGDLRGALQDGERVGRKGKAYLREMAPMASTEITPLAKHLKPIFYLMLKVSTVIPKYQCQNNIKISDTLPTNWEQVRKGLNQWQSSDGGKNYSSSKLLLFRSTISEATSHPACLHPCSRSVRYITIIRSELALWCPLVS